MELLSPFPDIEDFALALLESAGPTALATPEVIAPPLVVIRRTGGSDDAITDIPRIQVDCYGATRRQAADLAEQCRQLVIASPATGFDHTSIDQSWTESAPVFVPYGDPASQRCTATYRLALRRVR
ncbi:hypothetical protein [Amycolatopsis sp. NPDC004079]|uniref:hypothetical protein n=1 Tax=Amycolatopsis sp. NPDC004079 TaxID=3154549 RepID=UPI00339E6BE3